MDGLGQDLKLMSLGARGFQQISGGGLAGKQKYFAPGDGLAHLDGDVNTGNSLVFEDDVADQQVGTQAARLVNGILAGIDGLGVEAVLVENDGQGIGDDMLVIHYQDFRFGVAHSGSFLGSTKM